MAVRIARRQSFPSTRNSSSVASTGPRPERERVRRLAALTTLLLPPSASTSIAMAPPAPSAVA